MTTIYGITTISCGMIEDIYTIYSYMHDMIYYRYSIIYGIVAGATKQGMEARPGS